MKGYQLFLESCTLENLETRADRNVHYSFPIWFTGP
jgi:hypothetical protein